MSTTRLNSTLPEHLWTKVITRLDAKSRTQLASSSKDFRALAKHAPTPTSLGIMQKIPQDVMVLILSHLSEKKLMAFGLTSKKNLTFVWSRFERLRIAHAFHFKPTFHLHYACKATLMMMAVRVFQDGSLPFKIVYYVSIGVFLMGVAISAIDFNKYKQYTNQWSLFRKNHAHFDVNSGDLFKKENTLRARHQLDFLREKQGK